MAKGFELDISKLEKAMREAPEAAEKGARQGLDDVKDDWVRQSRDIAPLDTTNLRRQIEGTVEGSGMESQVIVTANASQRGFNYGYYIHEMDAGGNSLKKAGTEKKFLDKAADDNEGKWKGWLEEEIESALRKAGW